MSYLTQPHIYPASPSHPARARLRRLMREAGLVTTHGQSKKIVLFGDSTWRCPGGTQYANSHHALALALGRFYGNIPGTQIFGYGNESDAFGGRANFLSAGSLTAQYATTDLCGNDLSRAVDLAVTTGNNGLYTNFYWDNHTGSNPFDVGGTLLNGGTPWPAGNAVRLQVYGLPRSGAGTVNYAVGFTTSRLTFATAATNPGTHTGSLSMTLAGTPNTANLQSEILGPWTPTSGTYPQAKFVAATASATLLGSRWLGANPAGWLIDNVAEGGYSTYHYFGRHEDGALGLRADSGPLLAAVGYDLCLICLGTNDVYSGRTAEQMGYDLFNTGTKVGGGSSNHQGLMKRVRDAHVAAGKAPPLMVLSNPPYRRRQNAGETNYDTYKARHALVADEYVAAVDRYNAAYPGEAVFVNLHRMTYERGWNEVTEDTYGLTDNGAWATDTAMVAGEIRTHGTWAPPEHGRARKWKSLRAGTSGSTSEPGVGSRTKEFWLPVENHLYDHVHPGLFGAQLSGELVASALLGGMTPAYAPASPIGSPFVR